MRYLLIYLAVVNSVTVVVTVYDKIAAKKFPKNRIRENTLLLLGILGGAVGEYAVMQLIRHKTKHKRFMIGLPVIILLQAVLLAVLFYYKII